MKLTFTLMQETDAQERQEGGDWWMLDGKDSKHNSVIESVEVSVPKYLRCFVRILLLAGESLDPGFLLGNLFGQSWILRHSSRAIRPVDTRFQWKIDTDRRANKAIINLSDPRDGWHAIRLDLGQDPFFESLITDQYTSDMMIDLIILLINAGYKHCPCNT